MHGSRPLDPSLGTGQIDVTGTATAVIAALRDGSGTERPALLLVGDAARRDVERLAATLAAAVDVTVVPGADLLRSDVGGSEPGSRWDLVLCLDLPLFSGADTPAIARRLAAATERVCVAPLTWLADPIRYGETLQRWVGVLAETGLLYDAAGTAALQRDLTGALLLRRTSFSPAEALGYLTLALRDREHMLAAHRALAVDDDNRAALLTQLAVDLQMRLGQAQAQHRRLDQALREVSGDWSQLQHSPGFVLLRKLQRARARLAPPATRRERLLEMGLGWLRILERRGVSGLAAHFRGELAWRASALTARFDRRRHYPIDPVEIPPVRPRPSVRTHQASADIVVCVHNALDDVQRCLASVLRHTQPPYTLILVDDGSAAPTRDFLAEFARTQPRVVRLRNETARGYTVAANQGLRASDADFVVLLNSDTVVTPGWLDRLIACADSDARIGLAGPLSNTASWQSVPEIALGADWAENPLPPGLDLDEWAVALARYSARLYPSMPLLNGFCLLVRRAVLDEIGFFDEERFGAGYGEENDYCLRARAAGWRLALADDAYVYHAQSRSYSDERRKQLSDRAAAVLAAKHGEERIERSVDYCRHAAMLVGIRARAAVLAERLDCIAQGRRRFGGRRLLFLLPADGPGGGANVVMAESRAMGRMGVEVEFFNLVENRAAFEASYPGLDLPVHYGVPEDVPRLAAGYDAVIATWYTSVFWMAEMQGPVPGYYVQDFEPYFFERDSAEYQRALASYTAVPGLRCFTKTEWNRQEVFEQVGVTCAVAGPSVEIDRFRPRGKNAKCTTLTAKCKRDGSQRPDDTQGSVGAGEEGKEQRWQGGEEDGDGSAFRRMDEFERNRRPLHVVAMVRPNSPRRSPELTMRLLRRLSHRYGDAVEITVFGVEAHNPGLAALPQDFHWRLAGVLDPNRVASLMAAADLFVDFSTYQAMGLTALEAMASGAAVIVPQAGGAAAFARHEENALVVDTASERACWEALVRLVEDDDLRLRLQQRGIYDACRFYPERAAYNTLVALFDGGGSG